MFGEGWNIQNIPDQTGRLVVITGANSGIGFEAALALAGKNARVILAVRDTAKGENAVQKILGHHPSAEVRIETLNLASLESIRAFVSRIKETERKLDLLINNAGVMMPPLSRTSEGFELQFGTNHLGHFALTALLFDLIVSTVDSRIVTVSSLAHRAGKLDFDDLNWQKRRYQKTRAYADSKLANLYFTYELASKLENGDYMTLATAAHPGWTATNLQQSTAYRFFNPVIGQKASKGALPTLRAALDTDADYGDYYGPEGLFEMSGYPKKVESSALSHDRSKAALLWEISEEMTGIEFPVP